MLQNVQILFYALFYSAPLHLPFRTFSDQNYLGERMSAQERTVCHEIWWFQMIWFRLSEQSTNQISAICIFHVVHVLKRSRARNVNSNPSRRCEIIFAQRFKLLDQKEAPWIKPSEINLKRGCRSLQREIVWT